MFCAHSYYVFSFWLWERLISFLDLEWTRQSIKFHVQAVANLCLPGAYLAVQIPASILLPVFPAVCVCSTAKHSEFSSRKNWTPFWWPHLSKPLIRTETSNHHLIDLVSSTPSLSVCICQHFILLEVCERIPSISYQAL